MTLSWLERDIEDMIIDTPQYIGCQEIVGRQVPLSVGRIDVIGKRYNGTLVVAEIKKGRLDSTTIGQLNRYMSRIHEVIPSEAKCIGAVFGTEIDGDAQILAETLGLEVWLFKPVLMVNLAVGCPFPGQETWSPQEWKDSGRRNKAIA